VVAAATESWTEEQREIVEPMLARGPILNIFRALLTHPPAAKAFLVWGGYIFWAASAHCRRASAR
jgi:4-carboxymuconolactone decarboxylase